MHNDRINLITPICIIFSGLMIFGIYSLNNHSAVSQSMSGLSPSSISGLNSSNASNNNNIRTLSVTGIATTNIKPDKILINLGIQTTNKTADQALAANSDIMNKVINILKAKNAKENETSTSTFTISPNYNNSRDSDTIRNISSFTVSNSIQIQSSNINSTAKWIDSAISAGANNVNNVAFTLSDKNLDETKNLLIKKAINNARIKAEIATSALGLKIAGVKSISFNELEIAPLPRTRLAGQTSVEGGVPASTTATPIIPGEEPVSQSVSIVFFIY